MLPKINFGNFNISMNQNRTSFQKRSPKLTYLIQDTVSFSKRPEVNPVANKDKKVVQSERSNMKLAQDIYLETEYPMKMLKFILGDIFDTNVIDVDEYSSEEQINRTFNNNRNEPVVVITARRKRPDSISEKMSSYHIKSKSAAKSEVKDLIGARIMVSGTSTKEGGYVVDKLIDAVKKKRIKIEKIKNHGQENKSLSYASSAKLNKLLDAARKNGSPMCTYVDEPRDSGYIALHIITGEIADGYSAEIQVIGVDVDSFKELEDICYKCAAGKNLPKKYESLKEIFKPLKSNKKMMAEFLEYTKRAYAYERKKPIHNKHDYKERLPIPEDLNIPSELDFNNLQILKSKIDSEQQN